MAIYELEINPRPAEQGAERIVKSFKSIQDAMDKLDTTISERARRMVASFSQLSRVRTISREAISQLQALSTALGSFRGPSKTAVDNTTRFLNFLRGLGRINLPSGAGMASFLQAVSGFKGPTATAGRNTQSLLRALSGFSVPSGVGGRLTSFLTVLASYRGPHATAGKNTLALLNALSSFRGSPRNISAAIAAFDSLAAAISRAATAMGTFRRAQGGNIRVPSISGGKGGFNPRQYANDLGYMNTALLRTQTAFHALGGVLAAREFIMASNNIIKIRAQLEAATGSVQQARVQFGFITEMAEKLGLEIVSLSRSYGFFLGSIKGTNVTFAEAKEIFTGFSVAARALQLSTADVDGVFRALGQIMSKGKLQAEELRGQLGDRLPGAFVRFATALKMTKPGELDAALKKGAISGDRLKKAILEVARTMEVEFATSADKMSKTVDAAFNRLKNAFTFTAAEAGANGLNAALISIMDTLRKFVESKALSTMLNGLAKAFQFLGDHIEAVTYMLGIVAVSSTLKWVAALNGLKTLMTAAQAIFLSLRLAVAGLAAGLGLAATASALAKNALTGLFAVMRAHPFVLIATAIVSVVALMSQLKNANEENMKAAAALSETTADATNLYDAYINKIYNSGTALDNETKALQANTIAAIENARAKLGKTEFEVTTGHTIGWRGGPTLDRNTYINGQLARGNAAAVVNSVTRNGAYVPASNRGEFEQRIRVGAQLEQMRRLNPTQYEGYREIHTAITGDINTAIRQSQVPGGAQRLGYNAANIARQDYGDYNRETQTGGLSGEIPPKPDKGSNAAAKQYEADIKRALEAMRDLRRETKAAQAEMEAYLRGGDVNIQNAQARAEAEAQVNNFIDAFNTPAMAEKGIQQLTADMRSQVDILDRLSPAAKAAREELIGLIQAENVRKAQAQRGAEVAKQIDDLREENKLQLDLVTATAEGGAALREQTMEMEIQKQLRGVAPDDAARLEKALREQLNVQQQINDAMEFAKQINEATLQSNNMRDTMGLYMSGNSPEEIDYYKELIELRNKLKNDGYANDRINQEIALRAAILNQKSAYDQIQKEYEESRQMAQDMADAFVDGFQQAIESGQSFGKTLKDVFDNLKNIILNFVLYDPLRKWLTDVFTMGASTGSASTVTSRGLAIGSMSGSFGDIFSSLSSSLLAPGGSLAGGGGSSLGAFTGMGGPLEVDLSGLTKVNIPGQTGASGFDVINDTMAQGNDILVSTQRQQQQVLLDIPEKITGPKYFDKLGKIFDWKANSKAIGDLFKGGMSDLGKNIGPALQAVGQAFAMFETGNALGKSIGKAIGLGFKGSNILGGAMGGAAAGFSLGGPIGAAVGAVAGGILGFLKKKPKTPATWGSVVVGDNGVAAGGQGFDYGPNTTDEQGLARGSAGATLFNQFALSVGATLRPGSYGFFGNGAIRRPGPNPQGQDWYSLTGQMYKGTPAGREGVDWVTGTQSEVQAWALIQQVNRGMISGLSETLKTVFKNTKAKDMEGLQGDIAVGEAYDAFIKGSFVLPDVRKQVESLNDAYKKLNQQSKALGLSEARLSAARDRLLAQMKDQFNWNINQGILEITDPRQAAYNQLVKEYRDAVDEAMAVGGDLAAVEKLYGLKREEILKDSFESSFDAIRNQAKELLTSLTATQSSPLAPTTIFSNARDLFTGLQGELAAGNTANADQLSSYAQNYLGSAYDLYGSSTQYFDIFQQVTDFLRTMENYTAGEDGTGDGGTLPELPALQTLVDEINARNAEMTAAIDGNTGATVDVGTQQLGELERIRRALEGTGYVSGVGTSLQQSVTPYYESTTSYTSLRL